MRRFEAEHRQIENDGRDRPDDLRQERDRHGSGGEEQGVPGLGREGPHASARGQQLDEQLLEVAKEHEHRELRGAEPDEAGSSAQALDDNDAEEKQAAVPDALDDGLQVGVQGEGHLDGVIGVGPERRAPQVEWQFPGEADAEARHEAPKYRAITADAA